jgi:hypothetical protein
MNGDRGTKLVEVLSTSMSASGAFPRPRIPNYPVEKFLPSRFTTACPMTALGALVVASLSSHPRHQGSRHSFDSWTPFRGSSLRLKAMISLQVLEINAQQVPIIPLFPRAMPCTRFFDRLPPQWLPVHEQVADLITFPKRTIAHCRLSNVEDATENRFQRL